MSDSTPELQAQLASQIEAMRPWHHDILLFDDFSTGVVFSPTRRLGRPENDGVSLISPRSNFLKQLDELYPQGLSGKSFLDCACNGGGYCFWTRERDVARAVGFDVREHWIQQAKFVQQHRTVFPTDRIEFHAMDLYDVPLHDFGTFDLTYFSGIFYHLPDPVTGLKIAADRTNDVLFLNTAMMPDPNNPRGMTMARESRTKVMSGVHELSWFPNGQECLRDILRWLGFQDLKVTYHEDKENSRSRIQIVAGREPGRLDSIAGEPLL